MNTASHMGAVRRARSRSVVAVCILILIQVYRISAFSFAQGALAGSVNDAWFFPAAADVLFGITAPFMAYALWRRIGLAVWVVGLGWLSLSFFDFLDGLAAATTVGPPGDAPISTAFTIAWFAGWLVVDAIALTLLTGKSARQHYIQAMSVSR